MVESTPQLAEVAHEASLLGTLGIDWKLFLAQLVNFGVVVLVLWKWAYKPLVLALDERKQKIDDSLKKAEEIDKRMKRVGAEEGALMKNAHEKAQTIITEAESNAREYMALETAKTKKQVDDMVKAGKDELAAMKAHLLIEVKKDLAEVVASATEKIISEAGDKKIHAELVKKAQAALK